MASHAITARRKDLSTAQLPPTGPLSTSFSLSFEALYRRYAPMLLQLCRRRLRNEADAEEACQEALVKAYVALPKFREGSPFWPWLATIAGNVCIDIQRSRSKVTILEAEPRPGVPDPEEEVSTRLRGEIVTEALKKLPEHYRTHIYLKDYDGWTYEQISHFYGVSIGAVESTLLRARKTLKVQIKKVAEARNQWPLPVFVPAAWRRMRLTTEKWMFRVRNTLMESCITASQGTVGQLLLSAAANLGLAAILVLLGPTSDPVQAALEQPGNQSQRLLGSETASAISQVDHNADEPRSRGLAGWSVETIGQATTANSESTESQASSEASRPASISIEVSSDSPEGVPPTSANLTVEISREDDEATLGGKIESEIGGTNHLGNAGIDVYCDAGMVGQASCGAVDTLSDARDEVDKPSLPSPGL